MPGITTPGELLRVGSTGFTWHDVPQHFSNVVIGRAVQQEIIKRRASACTAHRGVCMGSMTVACFLAYQVPTILPCLGTQRWTHKALDHRLSYAPLIPEAAVQGN